RALRAEIRLDVARRLPSRRAAPPFAPLALRGLRLELRGVHEDDPRELVRPGRREDRPAKPGGDEVRDEAAVIQMRMRQQQRIDLARFVRERDAIAFGLVRASLEHAAIDEDACGADVEQVLRAGHRGRAAEKRELQCARPPWICGYSGRFHVRAVACGWEGDAPARTGR